MAGLNRGSNTFSNFALRYLSSGTLTRSGSEHAACEIVSVGAVAGGWKRLYAAKVRTDKSSDNWNKPCQYELDASLEMLTDAKRQKPDCNLGCLVLVDGSGSVSEEDFACMRSFIGKLANAVQDTDEQNQVIP